MIECLKSMLYIPCNKLFLGYFIFFFIFAAYLELSPKLGNIWLRKDSNGITNFHPASIIKLILKPLYDIVFWYPYVWDINFFIGGFIFSKTLYHFNLI